MKTEEEFQEYKLLLEKKYRPSARRTASVFGILAVITLVGLVYIRFTTEAELLTSKTEVNQLREQAEVSEKMILDQRQEVLKAIRRTELLEEVIKSTTEEVLECKKLNKKK